VRTSSSSAILAAWREPFDVFFFHLINLLYLHVDEMVEAAINSNVDLLQPFYIKFDPDTNSGIAVSIFGRTQGEFTKIK